MSWFAKSKTFLAETRSELKKVTFPSREEVIGTTVVVIIASVIFSIFLWIADQVIIQIYSQITRFFGA